MIDDDDECEDGEWVYYDDLETFARLELESSTVSVVLLSTFFFCCVHNFFSGIFIYEH